VGGELERRLARLRQGDHLCLIFESPEDPSAALVPFFKTGLAAGDRCFYIGPDAAAQHIERALARQKISVGHELERGALVLLTQRERWLPGGRFEPGEMMDLLRQTEQQALDDGFHGLRITWDMGWVLDGAPGTERLIEFEALLNRFLAGSRTSALCRYNRPSATASRLQGVLHTHPLAVLGEQICPNCFYEPPEMVLGDPSAEDQVDWMIARLRRSRVNEEKLEELSLRLAQKSAALERADRAKEDLLSMLAHELRNPLGTISNALQVLRLKGEGDQTWRRAIEAAERQVLHQALLVDDLLETSRVTRGQIELHCEELDVVNLVRETVDGYRESLRTARLELELELPGEPILVFGDSMRLSQALANLLQNATKFTTAGDRITVRVRRTADSRRVEVSVCDSGVGIAPEVLPYVFEVFTQADDSLDRARGGLGVGLAVVKGLVELHGGEVRARSEGPGRGAELTLFLPVAAAAPNLPEAIADLSAGLSDHLKDDRESADQARRILVVEDNPDAAATMRDFLELSGHLVELACSGTDGVQAARRFHPEVVLCDLGLPGMTGFEVAAQLRRDPETSSAKLIAVTGYGRDEDRRRSKEAGFDLHLTKPVDPAQLRQVLKTPVHH
jgi:signal transduction histidine kinase